MVGVAVKVTLVPLLIVPIGEAAIVILGVTFWVTARVTPTEVALAVVWQVLFAVSTQVTISPLLKLLLE